MHANTRDINRCLRTRERTCLYVCMRIRIHVVRARVSVSPPYWFASALVSMYTARPANVHTPAPSPSRFTYAALRDAYTIQRERECREGPCVTLRARKRRPTPLLGPREFTFGYSEAWRYIDVLMECEKLTRDIHKYKCIVKDLNKRINSNSKYILTNCHFFFIKIHAIHLS